MWGVSRLAEVLLPFQEGFCFMAFVHLATLLFIFVGFLRDEK